MKHDEFTAIAELTRRFATEPGAAAHVALGIGDDAAVLDAGGPVVLSIDSQNEGVHFLREWLSAEQLGARALAAALSDLAAMGARPLAALAALTVPRDGASETIRAITRGQAELAKRLGVPMIGGNLASGASLSITTTVIGAAPPVPLLRSGARPGDGVFVCGALGHAACGLAQLQAARVLDERFLTCWRAPHAQLEAGMLAAPLAHSAIDLSDGLTQDANHLAHASGVRIELSRRALAPHVTPLEGCARALGVDPWSWLLGGGEDYALLITAIEPPPGFTRIGEVRAGEPGVWLDDQPLDPRGFDHFG